MRIKFSGILATAAVVFAITATANARRNCNPNLKPGLTQRSRKSKQRATMT